MKGLIFLLTIILFLGTGAQEKKTTKFDQLIKELGADKFRVRKAALKKAMALSDVDKRALAAILLKSNDAELKMVGKSISPEPPAQNIIATKEQKIGDANNLKTIALALKTFADDYDEVYPGHLAELFDAYLTTGKTYISPGSKTPKPKFAKDLLKGHTDYVFLAQHGHESKFNAEHPLGMTRPGTYKGFVNVMFGDGHVRGFKTDAKTVKEVIEFLKKNGYCDKNYKPMIYNKKKTKTLKRGGGLFGPTNK